jgi:hypothetical protein
MDCMSSTRSPARNGSPVIAVRGDHARRILRLDVDPGADRAPADPEIVQVDGGIVQAPHRALDRCGPPRELLAEPDRHRVLKVRAPRLEDAVELRALPGKPVAQPAERGGERRELGEDGQADGGRNHVVGRLPLT